jgi:hypothetical protein
MEGQLKKWRSARRCAIWCLQRKRLSRDVIRYLVQRYLCYEIAYCWRCLRKFSINVAAYPPYAVHDGRDTRPLCGQWCFRGRVLPKESPLETTKKLLVAYDFLVGLSNAPDPDFGKLTDMQQNALAAARKRKKLFHDRMRKQMIADEKAVIAEKKALQRAERMQTRGK